MKTTKIVLGLSIFAIAGAVLFTSCRKKDKTPAEQPDNDYATASDNSLSENTANDALAMGSQLSENSGTLQTYRSADGNVIDISGMSLIPQCATVTAGMTGSFVSSYTVNFGTAGCLGQDYRTRKGMLVYSFATPTVNVGNRYRKPGFTMSVKSYSYEVDGNQVALTKTVTNTSPQTIAGENAYSGTNLTWHIVANVTIVKANNGGTITWNCDRTKELINSNDPLVYSGQQNPINWLKAKIKLNGTASGTNAQNLTYSAVATDLVRDFNCTPNGNEPHRHPFISGTVVYTPQNKSARTIDYGSGTCDFNATVNINGQTYTITVH